MKFKRSYGTPQAAVHHSLRVLAPCPECKGKGIIRTGTDGKLYMGLSKLCPTCKGTGTPALTPEEDWSE